MIRGRNLWLFTALCAAAACLQPLQVSAVEGTIGVNMPNAGALVEAGSIGNNMLQMMCQPSGIFKQPDGSFLVTDLYHKTVWRTSKNTYEIYAGRIMQTDSSGEPVGGYADGAVSEALFSEPWAVTGFMNGVAVSDSANHVVRYIEGGKVRTIAGSGIPGMEDGNATTLSVMLNHPTGLAADDKGNLFIADTNNNAVRRLDSTGKVMTCTTELQEPTGLFWMEDALYIADSGNNRILKLTGLYSEGGTKGKLTVIAGSKGGPGETEGFLDGPAAEARFMNPQGVAVSQDGTIYVADTGNGAVRAIKEGQVSTLLKPESQGMNLYLVSPRGLLLDEGTLYITDSFSRTIMQLQVR